jgi:hypothetical protein
LACIWNAGFQKFSGKCGWQVQKWMSGARASSANVSEKPTFTVEPSGRLPSRSNRMTGEAAICAARNAASSAAASADSRMISEKPSPRAMKSRL